MKLTIKNDKNYITYQVKISNISWIHKTSCWPQLELHVNQICTCKKITLCFCDRKKNTETTVSRFYDQQLSLNFIEELKNVVVRLYGFFSNWGNAYRTVIYLREPTVSTTGSWRSNWHGRSLLQKSTLGCPTPTKLDENPHKLPIRMGCKGGMGYRILLH